jgi:cobalt transporter subunit CbtB
VRAWPALGAALFGLMLFLVAGFAAPTVLHNSTHDTRHALGLPCH